MHTKSDHVGCKEESYRYKMVRIKQRYLLINILYPTGTSTVKASDLDSLIYQSPTPGYLDAGRFVGHLRQQIAILFGDLGVGLSVASLKIVYFSNATSTIILRVPRNHHRLVWAALTHINELPSPSRGASGKPCVIRVVRVSGTIRKAEEELIRRTRRDIVTAQQGQVAQKNVWPPRPSINDVGKGKSVPEIDSSATLMDISSGDEVDSE